MIEAPIPHADDERVEALRALLILDTAPEERFDGLTAYARAFFFSDIALVSLVDKDRQWFKSSCGLNVRETPRSISFCGHAILSDRVLVVEDALNDERFRDNPLVTGEPFIRFYAGAPLRLKSGHTVGTFCIIHSRPKQFSPQDVIELRHLADVVSQELERTPL